MKIDRDISGLFDKLNRETEYVVIKGGTNQHSDFPKQFYFKTDTDILVDEKMFDRVCNIVYDYAKDHFEHDWVEVDNSESDQHNGKIRVKMRGFSVFLFHVQTYVANIDKGFIRKCIEVRTHGEVCTLPDKYETIIRMGEFMKYPNKLHHKKYIEEHKSAIDVDLVNMAFNTSQIETLKELLNMEGI